MSACPANRTRTRTPGLGRLRVLGRDEVVVRAVEAGPGDVDKDAGDRTVGGRLRGRLGPTAPRDAHGRTQQRELLGLAAGRRPAACCPGHVPISAATPVTAGLARPDRGHFPPAVANSARSGGNDHGNMMRFRLTGQPAEQGQAPAPAAARRASTRSVRSQVKSGSSRPKWPYAAVCA